MSAMRRILITGAAGAIGSNIRDGLAKRCDLLRLTDIKPMARAERCEETIICDLTDIDAVSALSAGIDCVVHLAAIPTEDSWQAILQNNVMATFNVFEAARLRGVKRVVYASSHHAVGFHRFSKPIDEQAPPRPDSRYGVSKVLGEALGRLYADKYGLEVACLRIGAYRQRPENVRHLSTWIGPRDMTQLVLRCIEAPPFHFLVTYGLSGNTRRRYRDSNWGLLGYVPEENAESWADELIASDSVLAGVAAEFHGGVECAREFSGRPERID